ncbi:MAG: glycosyltransferase family 39 protein [Deltaproteobacteria bacterium]|nr:glycosyltransferase family 39 protein [Deltaproteobacteria bacterium]
MAVDEKGKGPIRGKKKVPSRFALGREDKRNLIILLAIGIALRLYAFCGFFMIAIDGAFQYIPVAKLFYDGEYLQALLQPQLPLYPFLISIVTYITGNFELSGQLLSIIFSLLALFPLYLIGRSLFGPKAAFWTTILYLANPLMLNCSVDVLKEGLLVFLFLSSVYCSLRFLQEGKGPWLLGTLAFSAAGALVSMISLAVLVVLGVWLGYGVLRGRAQERRLVYRYLWVVIAVAGTILIFLMPGLLGWEFWITKKPYKVVEGIFYRWFVYEWPSLSQIVKSCLSIISRFIAKTYPVPFVLALFGLGWRIKTREFSAEEKYLALLIGLLIAILFTHLYASGRYHLLAIFLLYLWAGFGFVKIKELLDTRFTRYRRLTAAIPVILILFGALLPISLHPPRLDKLGRKEVGVWLREHTLAPPLILTDDPRVAYYAGGTYLLIPPEARPEEIVEKGRKEKADYLVIEGKGTQISDAFAPFEKKGALELILRHPYGHEGRIVYVYKMKK